MSKLEIKLLADDPVTHITSYLSLTEAHFFAQASKNCKKVSLPYQKNKAQALKEFFQAVLDDSQDKVKTILDKTPWLLREKPAKKQTLKSERTYQLFNLEGLTALQITLLRNQVEMTKLILPYFKEIQFPQHEETNGAKEALKQWEICDRINEIKKGKIKEYESTMQLLIEDIAENSPKKIQEFRSKLLPKKQAINLDTDEDIEALLLAAYRSYDNHFNTFKDDDQRKEFCIKIIGFLQSLLSPETAKIFCEGFCYVIHEGRKPGDIAKSLRLVHRPNISFYRSSIDSTKGLGFEFLIPSEARVETKPLARGLFRVIDFEKLCQSKAREFCQLRAELELKSEPVTRHCQIL